MKNTLNQKQAKIIDLLLENEENTILKNSGIALERTIMNLKDFDYSQRMIKNVDALLNRAIENIDSIELKELKIEESSFEISFKDIHEDDEIENIDYIVKAFYSDRFENLVVSEWENGKLLFMSNAYESEK